MVGPGALPLNPQRSSVLSGQDRLLHRLGDQVEDFGPVHGVGKIANVGGHDGYRGCATGDAAPVAMGSGAWRGDRVSQAASAFSSSSEPKGHGPQRGSSRRRRRAREKYDDTDMDSGESVAARQGRITNATLPTDGKRQGRSVYTRRAVIKGRGALLRSRRELEREGDVLVREKAAGRNLRGVIRADPRSFPGG